MRDTEHTLRSNLRLTRFEQKFRPVSKPSGVNLQSEARFRVSGIDFFASLCLVALYVSITAFFPINSPLLGILIALLYSILAEYFTINKKMMISSILTIYFISQGFMHAFIIQIIVPGYDLTMLKYTPSGIMGLISPYSGMLMIAASAALLFLYWKYSKMPFAFALGALTLTEFPFWFLRIFFPHLDTPELDIIMFVGALGLFATAIWWDLSDVYRKTDRTEIAWWCHLFAGALAINMLAYWALGLNASDKIPYMEFALAMSTMSAGQAKMVFIIAALALFVSIVTDRRHYLVYSLVYLLIAVGTALGETSRFPAQAGMLLSVLMLGLIIFWNAIRHQMLAFLPVSVRAQLLRPTGD